LFPILLLAAFSLHCSTDGQNAPALTEVRRVSSGGLEVIVLATTSALKQTRNYCTLEFRTGADHHLVDVGAVTIHTTMTMEGEPMSGFVTDVKRMAPGRYAVEMVLAMTGNWQITIDWDGSAGKGTVTFPADVR
jgi:hypothetical protein